jgi:mannose-1-phosphate guanylyltransferase
MPQLPIKKAFIPSAGLGTRLRPLTDNLPKGLVKVKERYLITYALEHLSNFGIEEVVINTHHASGCWKNVFPSNTWKDIKMTFLHEPVCLETGGGIKNAEEFFSDTEDFIVYNSDVVSDIDLNPLFAFHSNHKALATLLLRSSGFPLQLILDEDGRIQDIKISSDETAIQKYLFTGIHVLNRKCFDLMKQGRNSSIIQYYMNWIKQKKDIYGLSIDKGFWYDLGTVQSIDDFETQLK